jgi:hypothetical protein
LAAWAHYTHTTRPPVIWLVLLIANLPFVGASIMWLALRAVNDKIEIAHWFLWGWLAIITLTRLLWR